METRSFLVVFYCLLVLSPPVFSLESCPLKIDKVKGTLVGTPAFLEDWATAFYGKETVPQDARHLWAAANQIDIPPKDRLKIMQGVARAVAGVKCTEVPDYPDASQYAKERLADPETNAKVKAFFEKWTNEIQHAGVPNESLWQWMKNVARQFISLPATLKRIHRIAADAYSPANMDTNLWAYFGFHQEGEKDKAFRMRPWPGSPVAQITPNDVEPSLSVEEMIRVMLMAMEIEAPIIHYTVQSGEGFLALLPGLARFMGKSEAQARYAAEHKQAWCSSPWCAEEDRHAPAFARMIERLTEGRWTPPTDNPTEVEEANASMAFAEKHVDSRMATEWSASSGYLILLAHVKEGTPLGRFLDNVMRDEVKHLAIISAAHVHLYGERPWMRLWRMIKQVVSLGSYHANTRTTTSSVFKNPVSVFEILYAFAVTEYHTRKWLKTLPPETLITIFETDSKLTELPEYTPTTPEEIAAHQKLLEFRAGIVAEGKAWRESRAGWLLSSAEAVGRQVVFNKEKEAEITAGVRAYNGFLGAEDPTGQTSKTLVKRFAEIRAWPGVEAKDMPLFRQALFYRLRDYQIANNAYIRNRDESALKELKPRALAGKAGRGPVNVPAPNALNPNGEANTISALDTKPVVATPNSNLLDGISISSASSAGPRESARRPAPFSDPNGPGKPELPSSLP